jgi:plastocyanin
MRHRRPGTRPLFLFLLVLTLLPATVVDAAERPRREPRGTTEVVKIRIVDNRFRNGTITIERGTVVKWRNRGDNTHTTTSNSGVWDSGNLLPGESFRRRFRQAGTFQFHCEIHSTMRGTITVT